MDGTVTLLGLDADRASAAGNAKDITGMAPSSKDDRTSSYVTADALSAELSNKVTERDLIINTKDYGLQGDSDRKRSAGSIPAGSAKFIGSKFSSEDIGTYTAIAGAGQDEGTLATSIATVINETTVSLAASASTSVTNAPYLFGTGDTSSIQLLLDGVDDNSYSQIFFPIGSYLTDGLRVKRYSTIGCRPGAGHMSFTNEANIS